MRARPDHPCCGVLGVDAAKDRRLKRPRTRGITMVMDNGVGHTAMADLLTVAEPYIDHWKFAFGTSALMSDDGLRRKLDVLAAHNVLTYPGGTLLEAAIVQQGCRVYMNRARELGFQAVEISDGTIDLSNERRHRVIDCARNAGLVAITEVGKKDLEHQPEAAELADQALCDLEWGAEWVIVEARESGRGIGIYDQDGGVRRGFLEEIASHMGDNIHRLIWEAPKKDQQAALVRRFGANVSLGNVMALDALALEALRSGLRYETLSGLAGKGQALGLWDPAVPEAEERLAETDLSREVSSHA